MTETEYRVSLDIYNGPMDLLLYLIRREEVDIHDIPIARITGQYCSYVEMLQQLDPNLAGEFLVLAATLMEIKTRMLLPSPELLEGDEEGAVIDPRADLVRQLLQYKAFKDAADELQDAADHQSLRFPRKPGKIDFGEEPDVDLDEVQIWDLFEAFQTVMESIGQRAPTDQEVIYDDTPIELHQDDILDRLTCEGALSFEKIFEGRTVRSEIVGLFVAVLELVRLRKILTRQNQNFGEIQVELNPNADQEATFQPDTFSEEDEFAEFFEERDPPAATDDPNAPSENDAATQEDSDEHPSQA